MKLSEIALKETRLPVSKLAADPNAEITSVTGIDHGPPWAANSPSSPTNATSRSCKTTQATAVLIDEKNAHDRHSRRNTGLLRSPPSAPPTPTSRLQKAHAYTELFYDSPKYAPRRVHETAVIARTARFVPEGAHIGPYCFI